MARVVLAPVAALAPFVRHIMAGGFESGQVHLPACADVQLLVYLRGGAALIDADGSAAALPTVFLVGAVSHPRLYRVEPGSRFVAATFRPGGLHACLGISAADVTGRIASFEGAHVLHDTLVQAPEAQAPRLLQALLERGVDGGVGAALAPGANLNLDLSLASVRQPVASLAAQAGISTRQFERRCLVSLGMPLRDYRRLARYSAAMMGLMLQGASAQSLASLAQEAGYVDQAHLTRDFSALVGLSPGRFMKQRNDAQYQLWQFSPEELAVYLK